MQKAYVISITNPIYQGNHCSKKDIKFSNGVVFIYFVLCVCFVCFYFFVKKSCLRKLLHCPWNAHLSHFCVRSTFAHRPFTVRLAGVHRVFIVHSFLFSVQRSLAFTVHKEFTVRSSCVHFSFIQHTVSIVIRNSEVEISISRSWNEMIIKR